MNEYKILEAMSEGNEELLKELFEETRGNVKRCNESSLDELSGLEENKLHMYIYYLIGRIDALSQKRGVKE